MGLQLLVTHITTEAFDDTAFDDASSDDAASDDMSFNGAAFNDPASAFDGTCHSCGLQ